MHTRIVAAGQIAVLAVFVVLIACYRDLLAEKFEPVKNQLFSAHDKPLSVPSEGGISLGSPTDVEVEEEGASLSMPMPTSTAAPAPAPAPATGAGAAVAVAAKVLSEEQLRDVTRAIFDPNDGTFPRLECPQPDLARYDTLKLKTDSDSDSDSSSSPPSDTIKYFFALDLTQCVDLLPRLLGSVVEAIRFLGPENCAVSIVEGNSDDGTPEVLEHIASEIESLGTEYFFQTSDVNPKANTGGRIVGLAKLRNLALQPMLDDTRRYTTPNTTVIFLNDVAICMEDILELVHQRSLLGADMTCAMDWTYVGPNPTFYDVWISRTISGESFFNIPEDRSWDYAWNLFWKDPETRTRYNSHLPFQVFSCWNGAVAFTAEPIVSKEVAFRSSNQGECFQGEPELLCKDFWYTGHGKIAVVPSVNLEYTDDRGKDIKTLKGYTSKWVGSKQDEKSSIDWQSQPPEQVKCMEVLEMSDWRPWNETLG